MDQAFLIVVIAVAIVGVAGAVAALLLGGRSWDGYGADALLKDSDGGDPRRPAGGGAGGERDDEVRQMLEARNARRARRGEPPLDVETELARLTRPAPAGAEIDPELREEIRGLVLARNARRARRGEAPLDVEAEIARQIDQLNL